MDYKCFHCGASLHEDASFCPYCTKSINDRAEHSPPKPVFGKALRLGLALLLMAGIALGVYVYQKPLVLDGAGEVIYTDQDGKYQLVLAYNEDPYEPLPRIESTVEPDGDYRRPCRLFIHMADSGADGRQEFLEKVETVTTEFIQPDDSPSPMNCSEPAPADYAPDAALVTSITYTGQSSPAELLWTIKMKNGDTILLRQELVIKLIETYDYYPEDVRMNTIDELQVLVDEIARTIEPEAVVNLHLPPVIYGGGLIMEERPVNLYGSADGEIRTTFTDTIRVAAKDSYIFYFHSIDFTGSADRVGIAASTQLHLTDCNITGWKTGVLGYGYSWVNVMDSQFLDNGVGFHFNSRDGSSVTHRSYTDNSFIGNETAIVLESVPFDTELIFAGSLFSGNDKDIDNLCDQPIDISEAIFQ